MKVTAETITDEQIRELRSELLGESNNQFTSETDATGMALYDLDKFPPHLRKDALIVRDIAREQCAAAWNARHGGEP